ncbi:MAG: aminotransferase class V-fold PLP-dependent enzyme [Bacteroidia bacterium]
MVSRRDFVKKTALAGTLIMPSLKEFENYTSLVSEINSEKNDRSIESIVKDESYWKLVRKLFNPQNDFINLENGYFSAQPQSTIAKQFNWIQKINSQNSFYMRKKQIDEMQFVKNRLAEFAQLNPNEFVICRNTTEALDTIIHGYPWQKGDEVIVNHQDYGSMLAAFEQQKRRSGIRTVYTKLPLHPKTDKEIVDAFESKITSKTRMLLVTHLINLTGQVLPVKKIVEMAHSNGVEVMLDSAHAFAHIPFKFSEIGADYVGSSLHKWLCCPIGLGLMHIKEEKINKIWPLFGDNEFEESDIRKFEHWGTRPNSAMATIPTAIDFHNSIGSDLKYERLFYLKDYWTQKAKEIDGIEVNTPFEKSRSGAIANFTVKGQQPSETSKRLFEEHNIFSVAIETSDVNGVRITPHLYTSIGELNALIDALKKIA